MSWKTILLTATALLIGVGVGYGAGWWQGDRTDASKIQLKSKGCTTALSDEDAFIAHARIARLILIDKFRNAIAQAQAPEEIYDIIVRYEV